VWLDGGVVVSELLRELGGVARRSALLRVVERAELDRAVSAGDVVRDSRGLYCLPEADQDLLVAQRYGGALALTSAAIRHGWAVRRVPDRPHVVVSRGRKIKGDVHDAHLHFAELGPRDVADHVTVESVTLAHCLRRLPFPDALAVADSALREGYGKRSFDLLVEKMRGPGSRQAGRVARLASQKKANPFESSLHAIADGVPGLDVRPQVRLTDGDFVVRPDLVDVGLRLVLEADSFEWHGKRSALASDTRRYNMLVVSGWVVLRFCYEDVIFDPASVHRTLVQAVALAELLKEGREGRALSA
jgi:very-short-patch-repair endonuclease